MQPLESSSATIELALGSARARFEGARALGEGAVGAVYDVYDRERGHRVALKLLKEPSADTLYMLKREFRTLANVTNPNLIAYHDIVVDGGGAFFTMELVPGVDFLRWVRRGAVVDEARLRDALSQLTLGLAALHDAGLVHRDIKPSNILVTPEGRVVLLDFGLALALGHGARPDGTLEGTVLYISPEQACGEALTTASDMYSVGALLYEALTGRCPFVGDAAEILNAKIQTAPVPPRERVPSVPEDLDRLCMQLLGPDPEARPGAVEVLSRLGVHVETSHASRGQRFVGREDELDRLSAVAERRTEARVACIRGPSGIGKSSLFHHLIERLRAQHDDLVLLQGRCYEGERIAFQAIDDVVDHLAQTWLTLPDREALLPKDAALLPRIFPVLGRVPEVAARASEAVDVRGALELRTRAFNALRDVFKRLSRRALLVVHLDDMQWADLDTLALLADLMRPPDPPALLLLLGSRPEGAEALRAFFEGTGLGWTDVPLEPLSAEQATRLAEELLGPRAVGAAKIVREAEGNPFFIGELVRSMQNADIATDAAPGTLDEVVFRRVATLPKDARRVLEGVALAAAPIGLRVAGIVAGLDPEATLRVARMLRVQRFVKTPAGQRQDRLEPYHDRIRTVVADHVASAAEVHRSLAQALEQSADVSPDQLAHHWFSAGDMPRAAVHAREAARRARAALNFDRAAELGRMLLDTGCFAEADRAALRLECAEALALAGRPREAAAMFILAVEHEAPERRFEGQRRAAEQLLRGGYIQEGLATISDVLREFDIALARTAWLAVVFMLLQIAWLRIRGPRWTPRDVARIRPHDLMRVDVYWSVGQSLAWVDLFRGFDFLLRALHLALRLGESKRIGRSLGFEAGRLIGTSEGVVGLRYAEIAIATGDPQARSYGRMSQAFWHYYVSNDWDEAARGMDGVIEEVSRAQSGGWELDTCQLIVCFSLLYGGRLAELSRRVPAYVREAERRGDVYAAVAFRLRLGIHWLLRDDPDTAERDLEGAMERWTPPGHAYHLQHFWALFCRCEIDLYRGQPERAASRLEADRKALARSMLLTVPILRFETAYISARVALAMLARCDASARRTWARKAARATRTLHRIALPVAQAFAALFDAALAAHAGSSAVALAALDHASERFEHLHMRVYQAATAWRRGGLIGGAEGDALVAAARASLEEEAVRDPARMLGMLAPGFEPPAPDRAALT